jgi:phosphotransferase system  glucose/maltose/N-acetylglucosamine-specific IIC component
MEEVKKNVFQRMVDSFSACMMPVIPILIAGGLLKLVILLIDYTGIFPYIGQTKQLLTIIGNAPFYFLPVFVAYSSALHFKINPMYALVTASVFLLPDFIELLKGANDVFFTFIPVYKTNYAYCVLPIVLLIYIMSYIIKGLEKIIPKVVKDIFLPPLAILCTSILGILFIGPIGAFLSQYVSGAISYLQLNYPVIAWAVMGAFLPVLVITGMHWIFVTLTLAQLGMYGVENGFMVSCFILSMTLSSASFVVFLKSSAADTKKIALSASLTGFLTGTSEPFLFGVGLPYKTPLIASMIAGGVAGCYQGFVTIHCYVYAFPGIPSVFMFSSPKEPGNLAKTLIAGSIAFVTSFILTFILYKDTSRNKQ